MRSTYGNVRENSCTCGCTLGKTVYQT